MTTRFLVVGATGQLGSDLVLVLRAAGRPVRAAGRADLDVTDRAAVLDTVARAAADGSLVVLNAAAWTDVDGAESEPAQAWLVNATAPGYLAEACQRAGARLVHVSTDYVFSGEATVPYPEDAPVGPRGAYGKSKAAGERAVLAAAEHGYVVRTGWLYGAVGRNFVKTMARLATEREAVDVVCDQRGAPTWSRHLAGGLVALADSAARPGVYHCTSAGSTSWYGFARAVFAELPADPDRVRPVPTAAVPRPAPRPAFSVLAGDRWRAAGLPVLPGWRTALAAAFAAVGPALRAGRC